MSERTAARLVPDVDAARRRLYALLRAADARLIWKRPASGEWSAVENVRHLIFAEQKHLGMFLPDGSAWDPMRLRKNARKTLAVKGGVVAFRYEERQLKAEFDGAEAIDLEGVLRAWDVIHEPIRKALKATGEDARAALEGHVGHLLRHVGAIEEQLAQA